MNHLHPGLHYEITHVSNSPNSVFLAGFVVDGVPFVGQGNFCATFYYCNIVLHFELFFIIFLLLTESYIYINNYYAL